LLLVSSPELAKVCPRGGCGNQRRVNLAMGRVGGDSPCPLSAREGANGRPGEISMCTRSNCACTDISPLACTTESNTCSGAEAGNHQLAPHREAPGETSNGTQVHKHSRFAVARAHRYNT